MSWLWYLCNKQQKMGTKSQRAVYEYVNILDDQVYEWVRFFKGQVYEWGKFWNTGSLTRTKITPKLPPTPTPESLYNVIAYAEKIYQRAKR